MDNRQHTGKTRTPIVHRQEPVIANSKLIDLCLVFDFNIDMYNTYTRRSKRG